MSNDLGGLFGKYKSGRPDESYTYPIIFSMDNVYEVKRWRHQFKMQLQGRSSSCRAQDLNEIPFPYAVCAIFDKGDDPKDMLIIAAPRIAGVPIGNGDITLKSWLQNLLSGPDKETSCKVAMVLWGVWKRRNSFVWNDDWQQTAGLLNGCASVLRAWRDAQQQVAGVGSSNGGSSSEGWVKPRSGRIKVNVDAALDLTKDIRAWSWVARNDQGEFIKAGGGSREARWSPEEAEAYGLREAIRTAIKEGWDLVDFKSDAQVVVWGLGKRGGLAYMDLILDDIHFLIHTKRSFSISYCKRSANRVAHALARSHVSISDHSFSYESIPRSIVSLMANDLLLI